MQALLLSNATGDLAWLVERSAMWDTQEESKSAPSNIESNVNNNGLQSTLSLSTTNINASASSPLINTVGSTMTPTPSVITIPQVQQNQQQQSPLSMSLPTSLLQASANMIQSSQMLTANHSNASIATLASTNTQTMNPNNTMLSSSLTSNELNTRFDLWTECLAELFVYKEILKTPLTRIEAWRMVFFRLTQLFPYVDPKLVTKV